MVSDLDEKWIKTVDSYLKKEVDETKNEDSFQGFFEKLKQPGIKLDGDVPKKDHHLYFLHD